MYLHADQPSGCRELGREDLGGQHQSFVKLKLKIKICLWKVLDSYGTVRHLAVNGCSSLSSLLSLLASLLFLLSLLLKCPPVAVL